MSSADQYRDCSLTDALPASGDQIPGNSIPETSGSSLWNVRSLTLHSVPSARDLPGFRFHPTEDELVGFYLRHLLEGRRNIPSYLVRTVDLYNYDPWELICLPAAEGETASGSRSRWGVGTGGGNGLPEADCSARYWYFFVPYASRLQQQIGGGEGQNESRQRKRKSAAAAARPTRLTKSGFWKATGTDTAVETTAFRALRKTLVFYLGRAPKGRRTPWVMNEYRADTAGGTTARNYGIDPSRAGSTLCRLRRKSAPESAAGGIGRTTVTTTVIGSVDPLPYVELSAAVNIDYGRRPVYHPQMQSNHLI